MKNDVSSLKRLVENEAVYRKHNESVANGLAELAQHAGSEGHPGLVPDTDGVMLQFYCECSDEDCRERLELPITEYTRIHGNRRHFIVEPRHQVETIEKIVIKHDAYYVVEKIVLPPENPQGLHRTDISNT